MTGKSLTFLLFFVFSNGWNSPREWLLYGQTQSINRYEKVRDTLAIFSEEGTHCVGGTSDRVTEHYPLSWGMGVKVWEATTSFTAHTGFVL